MATSYENQRPEMRADQARTLPAEYYTDPELFRRELRAVHHDLWLYAGRAERLPQVGSYFLVQFAGVNVIVLRGADSEIAAFHNVCRHRGTLLCKEARGTLPGQIQCSYHAWTYGLDGHLVRGNLMEKVVGFEPREHSLGRVATATWDGHVFLNLSRNPVPFEEHLAGLDRKFAPWGMAELRCVERRVYPVKANWKLILQNYSECIHCPIAHPQLHRNSHYLSGDNAPPQPTYLGGCMDLRDGVQTLTMNGQTSRGPLPGLSAEDRRHVYYYALLPNLLLNLHPDYMLTFELWPQAVDRTDIACEWHFHPDEIQKPGFDPGDAIEFWDLTNRQDWELSDLAQRGISSLGYRPGPYSNREELLHALDRLVLERLARREES